MHICTECGRASEDDLDFCPVCGSTKGANVDPALIPPEFKVVTTDRGTFIMRQNVKMVRIALLLALLPGILNIFGLGHLALKKYIRGAIFLAFSAFYYYERYIGYFGIRYEYLIVATLGVFFLQIWDIFQTVKSEYLGGRR